MPWKDSSPGFAVPAYAEEPSRPPPPNLIADDMADYDGNHILMESVQDHTAEKKVLVEKKVLDRMSACIETVIAFLASQQQSAQQAGRQTYYWVKNRPDTSLAAG